MTTTEAFTEMGRSTQGDEAGARGMVQRILYGVGGGALAFYGLRRRSMTGFLMAIAGGSVAYRGLRAVAPLSRAEAERFMHVEKTVTVNVAADEAYRFWRDLENLPRVLRHIESAKELGERRARFRARILPAAAPLEWDAELFDDQESSRIGWRSLPGSPVEMNAFLRFRDKQGKRPTEVHFDLSYRLPGGAAGQGFARALHPAIAAEVKDDLRRFKASLETGEVPTITGQSSGATRRLGTTWLDRAGGRP